MLALRAPAGGASADLGALEVEAAAGACVVFFPAVMEEPGVRRVFPAFADGFEGLAGNLAGFFPEGGGFFRCEGAAAAGGEEAGAPEDFVGHPVADAGEALLHEEDGFDRGLLAAGEEGGDGVLGKIRSGDLRRQGGPPVRVRLAGTEQDAAKEAEVGEDERDGFFVKDEVVVFGGLKVGGGGVELAGHAQMDAERGGAEAKEHLLAVRGGAEELRAGESLFHRGQVDPAKEAGFRMAGDAEDFAADPGVPLLAEIFHLGEFRHGGTVGGDGTRRNRGKS